MGYMLYLLLFGDGALDGTAGFESYRIRNGALFRER